MAWYDKIELGSPAYSSSAIDSETERALAGLESGKSFSIKKKVIRLLTEVYGVTTIFRLTIFISILSVNSGVFSQNIVQLHPIVGDTISKSEKVAFYLFPEIKDSGFVSGIIFFKDSVYTVGIEEANKEGYVLGIDTTMLNAYNQNIEKLIQYYSTLDVLDSAGQKQLLVSKTSINQSSSEYRLTEDERKQLVKDTRIYLRKKDKAEDLGLWGVDKENYIKASSNSNIFKAKIRLK